MRILYLTIAFSGVEDCVFDELIKSGHEVIRVDMKRFWVDYLWAVVSTFRFSGGMSAWRSRAESKYALLNGSSACFRKRSRWMEKQVRKHLGGFDLVLQISGMFSLSDIKKELNFPYLLLTDYTRALRERTQGVDSDPEWLALEKRCYAAVDRFFVPVSYIGESLERDYGVRTGVVQVTGYGSRFYERSEWSFSDKCQRILFVGKEFERKGGPIVARVFTRLKKRFPDLELHIVGPATIPGALQAEPGLEFHGRISDSAVMSELFASCDIFVLHPVAEPFGLVYLEAMSYGLACVGTRVDAMPDLLEGNDCGLVVDYGDEDRLYSVLKDLIEDTRRRRDYGLSGFKAIQDIYNWPAVVRQIAASMEAEVIHGRHASN